MKMGNKGLPCKQSSMTHPRLIRRVRVLGIRYKPDFGILALKFDSDIWILYANPMKYLETILNMLAENSCF